MCRGSGRLPSSPADAVRRRRGAARGWPTRRQPGKTPRRRTSVTAMALGPGLGSRGWRHRVFSSDDDTLRPIVGPATMLPRLLVTCGRAGAPIDVSRARVVVGGGQRRGPAVGAMKSPRLGREKHAVPAPFARAQPWAERHGVIDVAAAAFFRADDRARRWAQPARRRRRRLSVRSGYGRSAPLKASSSTGTNSCIRDSFGRCGVNPLRNPRDRNASSTARRVVRFAIT